MSKEENYCGQWSAHDVMIYADHVIDGQFGREHVEVSLRCGEDGDEGFEPTCDEEIVLYEGTIEDYSKDDAFEKAVDEGWTIHADDTGDDDHPWLTVTWLCPKCRDPDFKWPPGYIDEPCEGGEE